MMKQRLILLLLIVLPALVHADEIDGINYSLSSGNGNNTKSQATVNSKSNKYSGIVEIPDTVKRTSSSGGGWWNWGNWGNWGGSGGSTSSSTTYYVTAIADNAFSNCTDLISVTIPSTMAKIGNSAFSGCTSLEHIYSNMLYPPTLGTNIFKSVPSTCVLHIPIGTLAVYKKAGWTPESIGFSIEEEGDLVENFCLENEVNHQFIQNTTYPDDDYSYTEISKYTKQFTPYRKDLPAPVSLIPPTVEGGKEIIVEVYAKGQLVRTDRYPVESKLLQIWNLTPQTFYTYKLYVVEANDTQTLIKTGNFKTEGQVRMLNIGYVYNCRDIGGWKLPNGKHIKYGLVFRTGELEIPNQFTITEEGKTELLDILGVSVELDFGDYLGSPVKGSLEHYEEDSTYQIQQYVRFLNNTPKQNKNCFAKLVQSLRDGKKVVFHCNYGADRTGSFAFMLEGLLGVSESDMAKDYEMTSYTYDGRYRNGDTSEYEYYYKRLVNEIKTNNTKYPGNTFSEKIESMARGFGISQQDIDDFRALMIENDRGDTNGDDRVDAQDASLVLQSAANKIPPVEGGDVNDDGQVDAQDASLILQRVANKITW